MDYHKIINDVAQLERFIDWLPDTTVAERFFFSLQARKKYVKEEMPDLQSTDKTQLKRGLAKKKDLKEKIMQLECPVGSYRTKAGKVIPTAALVLYITPTPRDLRKSAYVGLGDIVKKLQNAEYSGSFGDFNPHNEMMSAIHRTKSRTSFVHFDVDNAEYGPDVLFSRVSAIVGEDAVSIVVTRGGMHLLVRVNQVHLPKKTNWYKDIQTAIGSDNLDQTGDLMVPVVGCTQGGHTPYFYTPGVAARGQKEESEANTQSSGV